MLCPCSGFGVTGMFQLVKARLTVPVTVLHTPDSLHYSGMAPVSEMQGQGETPRAPGMGTARVKGTMRGLRGFVGRKERKPAAAAWLVSTRPPSPLWLFLAGLGDCQPFLRLSLLIYEVGAASGITLGFYQLCHLGQATWLL